MSRSHKKVPIAKDGGKQRKSMKQIANRHYRRQMKQELLRYEEDATNPREKKSYKKNFESYDIYDYIVYWSLEQVIAAYYKDMRDSELYGWAPFFKRKHPEIDSLEDFVNFYYKRGPQYRK